MNDYNLEIIANDKDKNGKYAMLQITNYCGIQVIIGIYDYEAEKFQKELMKINKELGSIFKDKI